MDDFLEYDDAFNTVAGIYELDKSMKYLQEKLEKAIDDIANDNIVNILFWVDFFLEIHFVVTKIDLDL